MNFNDVKELAAQSDVAIHAACLRSGLAISTPHRWSHGSTPGEKNLARMRAAVVVIAHERGTLPSEYADEVPAAIALLADSGAPPDEVDNPHEIVQGIEKDLRRLKRSLKANGVQATAS